MKLGDLVMHLDRHWIVSRYDPKRTRTAVLLAADGTQTEIPHDLDAIGGAQVIANPSEQWPFVVVPPKNGYVIAGISHAGVVIEPITGWVASDPTRTGGPVFLAPNPRLRYGETLLVRLQGIKRREISTKRVDIPREFGTVKQRTARAEAARTKPEEKANAFSRLLSDDQIGDDD
jgi:hypothetical protein